ncbi:lipopolysaccharide biosynthesis protein [Halpernia frigidisoli]|uniref:Membrane protein involved in the export of O-antigen and teichoic acid n=1 Tax=Halpernia frigidisoli TaxID=1125876 RepID=A0A1I3F9W1_9FLAO|nr:oligosaccharide flippase family protein [Halpernia frigidisoli]SFI08003.1 Membrane protein involved in the export of O-antigen and teichoic acid [Halpernia frigidisoli]
MSVIARQGFKYSIIGYLGFLLGTLSAIFIFPYNMEFYGKLRYIMPMAEIILPIVVFGLSYSNVKFFFSTKNDNKHQNLLSLSLIAVCINFLIFIAGFFIAAYFFPELKVTQLWKMKMMILPLVLVLGLSTVFNKYISNFKRIVVPNILDNVLPKIANLGAFFLFFFLAFPEKIALFFFFGMFVLGLIAYYIYTNKLEKFTPNFSTSYFKKDKLYKQIFNYSFYGFLGNIGTYIALRIDNVMIGDYLGFQENGVYSTLLAIISLISIPSMGLYAISAPLINKHLELKEYEELDVFHKKTSLTLFFLGLVLFSCICVGFPFLTSLMKNGELLKQAEPVIWILGISMLFDLATGFNGYVISLSKFYKFSTFVMVILAVVTIALNLYFIKNTNLGLMGIALATGISLTLYNIIKIIFNYVKFKVQPFTIEMIYASIIGSLGITVAVMLPDFKSNLINLFYKPAFVLILFLVGNHFLKIFPLEKYLNKEFIKSIFKF